MTKNTKAIIVRIDPKLYKELKSKGFNISGLCRQALKESLKKVS